MIPLSDVLKEVNQGKRFKGHFKLGIYQFIVTLSIGPEEELFDEPMFTIHRAISPKPYPHIYSCGYDLAIVAFPEILQVEYTEISDLELIKELYWDKND